MRSASIAVALGVLLAAAPAIAQSDAQSATAKANGAAVTSGDATKPEHLLGDWGGLRTRLTARGVDLKFGYLTEIADVASGGRRHAIDYAHQVKLQADLDLDLLTGWRGWSMHGTLLERAGRNASADYLGDDLDDVQEIYGSTKHAAAHLGQLYAQHIGGGRIALDEKAGRLPVGADFAGSPLYCQFVSLGLCPQPRGLSLDGSFSIDPSSTWGGRVKAATKTLYVMAGLYQVRPRYGGPSGFDIGFSHDTGVIVPVELGFTPRSGAGGLQGHYKLGAAIDTSDRANLAPAGPGHGHHAAYWAEFDQMLWRTGADGTAGLILLGGWTHADPATSVFRDYGFVGLTARGVIAGRPADSIDLLATLGQVSGRLTAAQRAALATGDVLPTGFAPAPGSFAKPAVAPGVQTRETIIEANYAAHLADGLVLTPDVQYVVHPGGTRVVRAALVLAGRLEVNF